MAAVVTKPPRIVLRVAQMEEVLWLAEARKLEAKILPARYDIPSRCMKHKPDIVAELQ